MIIDAKDAVLGRLASIAAKRLLAGSSVMIVNAELAIMTGRKNQIVGKYLHRRDRGSPQHGPFFPTKPELMVRRTVRGRLPKDRRRNAIRKLRVYIGNPRSEKAESIAVKAVRSEFIRVGELAKILGWRE